MRADLDQEAPMTDFSADNPAANDPRPFTPLAPLTDDDQPPERGEQTGSPNPSTGAPAPSQPGGPGGHGGPGFGSSPGGPLGSSTPSFAPTATAPAPAPAGPRPAPASNGTHRPPAEVKGRIEVADEVVEKVAGLAAMEVEGVADLGGDFARALESVRERIGIGQKRGDQGVKARISGRDVAIDVVIMIEYGYVVMDVAREVKNNVALQANRMLGLRVVEVNVTVDDVRMPKPRKVEEHDPAEGLLSIEG
jgi:uncharacterized alkaline shock family protein YloU